MNNLVRALLRVSLTAVAFTLMSHLPIIGVAFHGTILGALGLALALEACIWIGLLIYASAVSLAGFRPQELPGLVNSLFLWLITTGFLSFVAYKAPSTLSVGGFLPALAGGFVLLLISMAVMWRSDSCSCGSHEEEDSQ